MIKAVFVCDCGKKKEIEFEIGKAPKSAVCDCGKNMKRQFSTAGTMDISTKETRKATDLMLYGGCTTDR